MPCPRCGSMKLRVTHGPMGGWWVECLVCGRKGIKKCRDVRAIDAWNKEPRS